MLGSMNISLHLVLAVALVSTALVVVLTEVSIRRRLRSFRVLQLFTLGSALLLVPSNITALVSASAGPLTGWIVVGSIAVLIVQFVLVCQGWIPMDRVERARRVLAIGAHPDDLELACGGTLARLADAGHEIHALVMSDGAIGGDATVRPGEATRAADFLGLAECTVLGLPDTRLGEYEVDMTDAIEARIKALNPDIILTHSSNDHHQDHQSVHWATLRAGRRHPAILCYESPSATSAFSPQVFVEIDDYVDAKAMAVALHGNQSDKPYMGSDTLGARATFRGEQARLAAAEGFEAVRVPAFSGVL